MNESDRNVIIDEYDKIFREYSKHQKKKLDEFLQKNQSAYSCILNKLLEFYFIAEYFSSHEFQLDNTDKIFFTLYTKCSLNLLGIYNCLNSGTEVEANIILRSLYETFINVALINEDNTRERLRLFDNYQHIDRYKQILAHQELIKKYPEHKISLSTKEINDFEDNYNKVKNDYIGNHWASKELFEKIKRKLNLKIICEYLGYEYEREYIYMYKTLSKVHHGGAILEKRYLKITDEERVIVNSPKFTNDIFITGYLTIDYVARILLMFLDYINYTKFDEIKVFIEDYLSKLKNTCSNFL